MNVKKLFRDHGADIFSILAGIGVFATGIAAYNAGKDEGSKGTVDEEGECQKTNLLLPVSLGTVTISCIGAARYFGFKKEESLLAASAVLSSYCIRRSKSEYGDSGRIPNLNEVEDTGTGDIIFIEDFTGRQFRASREHVDWALARYEEEFCIKNHATLNELYSFLELPTTCAGEVFGWSVNQNCPKEYQTDDFIEYDYALTKLGICYRYYEGLGYVIFYPNLPILDIAGTGGPHE